MSGLRLLLQVFSLLALVLNGASPAGAGLQGTPGLAAGQGTMAAAGHPAGSCHDRDPADRGTLFQTVPADAAAGSDEAAPPSCCDPSGCGCACASCPSAMVPAAMADGLVCVPGTRLGFRVLAHAAPPLPHVIRPPIV